MSDLADPVGLERAFREHADRLYAYCLTVAADPAAAVDAVHDAFVIAGELEPPADLRPWLYALGRHECLARPHRAAAWEPGGLSTATVELGSVLHAGAVTAAVHEAMAGLNAEEQELAELSVRHGFTPAEIGLITGQSPSAAGTKLSRVMGKIRRTGAPAGLFGEWAALPFPAASGELWTRLRRTRDNTVPGLLAEVARRVGPLDQNGYPRQPSARPRRSGVRWTAIGVSVAATLLLGTGAVIASRSAEEMPPGPRSTEAMPDYLPERAPSPSGALGTARASASPSKSAKPTPSKSATPSAAPSATRPPSASPSGTSPSATPSASTVSGPVLNAGVAASKCQGGWQSFTMTATLSGGTASRMYLRLEDSSGKYRESMSFSNGQWAESSWGYVPTLWWVEATLPDGRTLNSAKQSINVC
ncbi:RNA polymerase sigma factor [Longispora albida]|uniref:RNA polymerase sigma factor n=1 Tax=Longispora albida TaxID=203523 RepID=UPI0003A13EF8|nr:sigma-70 family RNA polymerase sigma factor [Longispora albida]